MTDLDETQSPSTANATATREERLAHAVLDLDSRRLKALKIERLIGLDSLPQPVRMLEVGVGSGGIAHYFGTHDTIRCQVDAVDVCDNRLVQDGYRFHQVAGTTLPFPDDSFDVVITNHVIEHVGEWDEQCKHLAEVHRVLQQDGTGYLAVPNRWMVVEPHYRLPFLSWLPKPLRTPYLRLSGKGRFYDCEPLELGQLERMLVSQGFAFRNLCIEALRQTYLIERPSSLVGRFIERVPDGAFVPLLGIIPTLIYELRKRH